MALQTACKKMAKQKKVLHKLRIAGASKIEGQPRGVILAFENDVTDEQLNLLHRFLHFQLNVLEGIEKDEDGG